MQAAWDVGASHAEPMEVDGMDAVREVCSSCTLFVPSFTIVLAVLLPRIGCSPAVDPAVPYQTASKLESCCPAILLRNSTSLVVHTIQYVLP